MLKDKIWVEKGFQTSVNIAYDLHNKRKILSFIPTLSAIDVIEDVMLSTSPSSTSRARILIGAYGKGKSHIILILLSLLLKKDVALFDVLLNKVKVYNSKLYDYIINYLESEKKLLPIIISGSSASLTQSFLNAMQQALKNEDLTDLMPETNFKAARNAIELWKNDYPGTYESFKKEINIPVEDFVIALQEYDVQVYEEFEQLYPKLTSGSSFNPFLGFDVVELYEKVTERLKDKGFDGVYIIYDEFSKYLESNISNTTISDIKLLQDFAEKCDRSGEKQMHLMLISHKDIANYIDKNLPKEKVDGWRGVSGRFKHINLHNNFSQMYEIISEVIKKDNNFWVDFCGKNDLRFSELIERFKSNGLLDKKDNFTTEIAIKGCYPLHPVSTFILPRLSEKVAQNERTLFTFLSSDNKYTLNAFLENSMDAFPLLTPDYIYDYFEPLLRKEPYTSDIHKIYEITSKVLKKIEENSLSSKIIKTISLIYIIEQFEKLPPIHNVIVDTFIDCVSDISEIEAVLTDLIDKECIVYLKRSNGYLRIKESSGVDIPFEIQNVINKSISTLDVKDILNKSSFDSYIYPTAYNDEMEITRYFDFSFINSSEFFAIDNWNRKIENTRADGVVYAIIPQNKEEIEIIKAEILSEKHNHNRIIFIVPNKYIDIERIAFEYYAVRVLKSLSADDDLLSDEYDIYLEDLEEVIVRFILGYSRPENGNSEYFWNGQKQAHKRKAQLSSKLSEICAETYHHTPVINNESINKDVLSSVAITQRTKLINGLLENDLKPNLGLTGTGQDVSFMRSTLIITNILEHENDIPLLNLTPPGANIRQVLLVIQEFFNGANTKQGSNFKILYDLLIMPQYGYGLKKGVIPIYIAVVLHFFKKYLVIKNKAGELNINAELLNSINENPQAFTAFMEDWNDEKTLYIESMAELFAKQINAKEKDYNSFTYIVAAMTRWYMGLPKYAKELKNIYTGMSSEQKAKALTSSQVKFINSLKQSDINAREYLFEKLFDIFNYKEFTVNIIDNIRDTKCIFDTAKAELIKGLILDVKEIFKLSDKTGASQSSIIKDWTEKLKLSTINHLFPNGEDRILQLMVSIGNDDKTFIERLAKAVTDLRLDDWTNETIHEFYASLEAFKRSVLEYDRIEQSQTEKVNGKANVYKLTFVGNDGYEIVKTFDKTNYSERGKLLLNEILNSIDEMGQSISEQEKRQIIMEILERLC